MQGNKARLLQLAGEHRAYLINSLLCTVGGLSFLKLGQFCAGNADDVFGTASWKTYNMFGNSGRSPIFPHFSKPYIDDIEGRIAYEFIHRLQKQELCTTYRIF